MKKALWYKLYRASVREIFRKQYNQDVESTAMMISRFAPRFPVQEEIKEELSFPQFVFRVYQ